MIITYGGLQIAADPIDGGTTWTNGPLARAKQKVQVVELLRSASAVVYARGNLVYPLELTITPMPYSSSGAALIAMLGFMQALPPSGPLVLTEDGYIASFTNAAIESLSAPYKIGLSFAVDLSFQCVGLITQAAPAPAYTTQGGATYTDQAGDTFTSNS